MAYYPRGSYLAEKFGGHLRGFLKVLLVASILGGLVTCRHYACVDKEQAEEVLKKDGRFNNATFQDTYQWWTCGHGDAYATGFTAINSKGDKVSGTVCCGLIMKDCTIRW